MNNETMEVTRQMKLREASLIRLFDLEAQFADLHYGALVNGLGHHSGRVQEHLKEIVREIKRR